MPEATATVIPILTPTSAVADPLAWFHAGPSPEWQWVFAALGVLALMLAIAPFPVLIWGSPKLQFEPEETHLDDKHALMVVLANYQHEHPLLRRIGVRRGDIADLAVDIGIRDLWTDAVMFDGHAEMQRPDGTKGRRISLPASWHPVPVVVAAMHAGKAVAHDLQTVIPPGDYIATVFASGSVHPQGYARGLTVTDTTLNWRPRSIRGFERFRRFLRSKRGTA